MFPRGVGRRGKKGRYHPAPQPPNPQRHGQNGLYTTGPRPNGLYPGPSNPQHPAPNGLYPGPSNLQPLGHNSSVRALAPPPTFQQYQWTQTPPSVWFRPPHATPQATPPATPQSPANTAYAAKRRKRQNSDRDPSPPSKQQRVDPPGPPASRRHGAPAGTPGQRDHHPANSPRTPESPQVPTVLRSHSPLYPYATDKLSCQMLEVYESSHQRLTDLQKKEVFRTWLQADINRLFPDARLYLTGSSMSGLACRSSDADLCLVLDSWSPPPRGFLGFLTKALKQMRDLQRPPDPVSVLSTLLKLFHTLPYLRETHLIRAKVPILRFIESVSGVEFDLNVNNTVGIRNTFLLRTYGEADPRVKPLILVVKKWARYQQINDASKGTLSSYTLVLMVLSYLQILQPPVLPSLQRDFPECFHPAMEIDMVPQGPRNIPAYLSENQSSLGDLLLGFLQHYATVFKWDKEVVSVREARRLTKDRRGAREFISVEEPFERNNVARAVHEKIKFDAIRAQFTESYQKLSQKKELNSILPVAETIAYELSAT